jgi:hypothetical protein
MAKVVQRRCTARLDERLLDVGVIGPTLKQVAIGLQLKPGAGPEAMDWSHLIPIMPSHTSNRGQNMQPTPYTTRAVARRIRSSVGRRLFAAAVGLAVAGTATLVLSTQDSGQTETDATEAEVPTQPVVAGYESTANRP